DSVEPAIAIRVRSLLIDGRRFNGWNDHRSSLWAGFGSGPILDKVGHIDRAETGHVVVARSGAVSVLAIGAIRSTCFARNDVIARRNVVEHAAGGLRHLV